MGINQTKMAQIDSDLSVYMISRIQVDLDPYTIFNLKTPEDRAAADWVEKKLYPIGINKIVDLCRRNMLAFFSKQQRRFNAAKNFLEKKIIIIIPLLNFIIKFNKIIKNENPSFPLITFKNFDYYSYDPQSFSYWYISGLHIAGIDNKKCISCLRELQASSKKYKKLPFSKILKSAQEDLKNWKQAIHIIHETLSDAQSRYLVMKLSEKLGKVTPDPSFIRQQFVSDWVRNGQSNFIYEVARSFTEFARKKTGTFHHLFDLYEKMYKRQKMLVELLQKDLDFALLDMMPFLHNIPDFKKAFDQMSQTLEKICKSPTIQKEEKERALDQLLLLEKFK